MFDLRMSLSDNFASFKSDATGETLFVDSFDNREFNARLGTAEKSTPLGSVAAASDEELNSKLSALIAQSRLAAQ